MSVLVTNSQAVPDRSLPADYSRAATINRSELPSRAEPLTNLSYTRSSAAYQQPGVPSNHRHSRTVSSAILPSDPFASRQPASSQRQPPASLSHNSPRPTSYYAHSRQSSVGSNMNVMQRQGTTASTNSAPRRSTSSRSTSTNNPTSYVALMRKQKATVWCDRSQNTDPRFAAAQRAAKQRAALEVNGSASNAARTSTITSGGVVGKIRHGGIPKAPGYSTANMSGAGVPLRLSANEMLGDDENEGRSLGDNAMVHGRSGSGKSSASSTNYRSGYPRADQGRFSTTSTPPSGNEAGSPGNEGIPELSEEGTYTGHRAKRSTSEDSFGDLKDLSGPNALQQAMQDAKKAEDLRRRGSVDERTMSMGPGVRLFVANPDVDD